jgi:hypothetical protein
VARWLQGRFDCRLSALALRPWGLARLLAVALRDAPDLAARGVEAVWLPPTANLGQPSHLSRLSVSLPGSAIGGLSLE